MRVLSIIGTRPEALKMAPVIQCLARTPGIVAPVCLTGQHRELVRDSLALFRIEPDFDLRLMQRAQSPEAVLAGILARLGPIVSQVRPDWILAVGDTSTVLGASLVAVHQRIRFGHVEAGLRSSNKWDPFPEELNRRLTTVLADLHFAPTAQARRNLRRENIAADRIVITGNPIIDTLEQFRATPGSTRPPSWWKRLNLQPPKGKPPRLVLVTFHRRENIGRPMRNICAALRDLARAYRGTVKILCIVHPNPAVREPAYQELAGVPHITLARPLSYPRMIFALHQAQLVLTDSGGLQEEAPCLRIPVLVLRKTTERPEGVAAGVARLVGTERQAIVRHAQELLDDPRAHRRMSRGFKGYGDGQAARRIVAALLQNRRA